MAQVAIDGGTARRRPRWVGRRLRRERADAIAAYHREITARARAARLAAAHAGVHVGRPPYGYRLCDRRLIPDATTASVVRLIFRLRVVADATPARIAAALRRCPGLYPRPVGRGGAPLEWSGRVVSAILANPRYTGRQVLRATRREHGHDLPAVLTDPAHPALVDDGMWWRAQPPGTQPPEGLLPTAISPAIAPAVEARPPGAGLRSVPAHGSEGP